MDERPSYGNLETDGAPICPARLFPDIHNCSKVSSKSPLLTTSHSEPLLHCEKETKKESPSRTEELEQHLSNLTLSPENSEPETKLVQLLEYMDILYEQDKEGDTKLHLAIINEETSIISDILQNTYSQHYLSIRNNLGQTPLHVAIAAGQPEVARILLACGTDPTIQDFAGRTALHIACEKGEMEAVKALTLPLLSYEIKLADNLKYKVQCPHIPQRQIRNYEGENCIHIAAKNGRTDIIEHLVNECGHDINSQEHKGGKTILHIATETNSQQLTHYLLYHHSTDTSIQDYNGLNPLIIAHYHPHILSIVHSRYPMQKNVLWNTFVNMVEDIEDDNYDPPTNINGY